MLFIRREAYERSGLTRESIDERLGLTADEFVVEGSLISIGPLPDGTDIQGIIGEMEDAGLVYFDDFFELTGNWPEWMRLFVAGA